LAIRESFNGTKQLSSVSKRGHGFFFSLD